MQGPWGFSYKIAFCYVAFFFARRFFGRRWNEMKCASFEFNVYLKMDSIAEI